MLPEDTRSTDRTDCPDEDPHFPGLQARFDKFADSIEQPQPFDLGDLRTQLTDCRAELDGLRTAMANRAVIEQAKGMVMVMLQIDEAAAFAYLREASNRTNRRLAEIAADVVRTRAGLVT